MKNRTTSAAQVSILNIARGGPNTSGLNASGYENLFMSFTKSCSVWPRRRDRSCTGHRQTKSLPRIPSKGVIPMIAVARPRRTKRERRDWTKQILFLPVTLHQQFPILLNREFSVRRQMRLSCARIARETFNNDSGPGYVLVLR